MAGQARHDELNWGMKKTDNCNLLFRQQFVYEDINEGELILSYPMYMYLQTKLFISLKVRL